MRFRGFTLVELLLVILITGLLAVSVMPKWTASSLGLEFEARRVLNDIRYTQALSMASGQRYRFVKISASAYRILNEAGVAITLPGGGTQQTLSGNVSFGSLGNLPGSLIAFNSQGTPYTNAALPGTALAAVASIPLMSNGQTRTVMINPETGYGALQ